MKLLTQDPSPAEVTIPLFLHRASCGFPSQGTGSDEWMMRQEHLSPCYTTRWEDLPVAR